ncbi:hypothetical protein K505DRAFT_366563 [Melanomma pulvis-pyrius CBS 109.77]|uniref:Lytic polysaccharide monooxygenase n=1 Tax=Melanomma pulvis-pyrius CBS 109.77 TaxID=1314802 RepID=A0A6A6WWS3_9PLEO|nr:hypothetical protein K505DRAFT_366563 [Melanomma pulvis-pyrius CBS 109.77]
MRTTFLIATIMNGLFQVQGAIYNNAVTDSYDDLGTTFLHYPPLELISDGGVIYNSFNYYTSDSSTLQIAGLRRVSGSNAAVLIQSSTGSIATTGRCVKLQDFWFGCSALNGIPSENIPMQCNLTLTAYKADGTVAKKQDFLYTPNNRVLADMKHEIVEFPGARVIYVETSIMIDGWAIPAGPTADEFSAASFDNVTYTQYEGNSQEAQQSCGF